MELSIIVSIYNVEKYLKQCLESLYSIKNIKKEIILVNDESPDESYKIIEKYKNLYPGETVIINKKNGGLSSARNAGLKVAKGKYISFIDSDDWVDTEKYQKFIKEILEDNVEVGFGNALYYYDSSKKFGKEFERSEAVKNKKIKSGKELFLQSYETNFFRMEVWDNLYNRDFLLKNNLFFKEGLLHEDEEFTIRILMESQKVKYYDIPFYFYRQREGSIMQTRGIKNLKDMAKIARMILEYVNKDKKNQINNILCNRSYSLYRNSLLKSYEIDKKEFEKIYKNYREDYNGVIKYFKKSMKKLAIVESGLIYHNFKLARVIGNVLMDIKIFGVSKK